MGWLGFCAEDALLQAAGVRNREFPEGKAGLLSAPGQALFLLKDSATGAGGSVAQLDAANKGIHTALAIALAVIALQLVWTVGKMGMQEWRKRVAAR